MLLYIFVYFLCLTGTIIPYILPNFPDIPLFLLTKQKQKHPKIVTRFVLDWMCVFSLGIAKILE